MKRPPIMEAAPFKIDGVYCRFIPLSKGQIAIVDAADYSWLAQYNWHVAWCPGTRSFYALTNLKIDGRTRRVSMHRMILGLTYGDRREGDHAESNTLDNRRKNLRIVTHHQNSTNRRTRRNTKAGLKGVSWHSRDEVWEASIRVRGKLKHLGTFHTAEDAHAAYREAATKQFGEYARFA